MENNSEYKTWGSQQETNLLSLPKTVMAVKKLLIKEVVESHDQIYHAKISSSWSCPVASTDIPDPLVTFPYRSSPLAGLQGYIPYPHIAAVCTFLLVVLLLLGHMWGSIGVHHLWARPCFSSSVLRVCFV